MALSPIALFAYNRPDTLKETVEALEKNLLSIESELFVFSDGAKNNTDMRKVSEVRKYIETIDGFKKVVVKINERNLGLANSIIDGVTRIVNDHGKVIVLEDDLVSSPFFLKFMNEALDLYNNEETVGSICGYFYNISLKPAESFFLKTFSSCGWATWKRAWRFFEKDSYKLLKDIKKNERRKDFDLNGSYPYIKQLEKQVRGKVDSWAIRWYASLFLNGALSLYPGQSLINHIGFGADSTHNDAPYRRMMNTGLSKRPISLYSIPVEEDLLIRKALEKHIKRTMPSIFERALFKHYRFLNKLK